MGTFSIDRGFNTFYSIQLRKKCCFELELVYEEGYNQVGYNNII